MTDFIISLCSQNYMCEVVNGPKKSLNLVKVVTASESGGARIGSLFIITCMGGTIGRAEDVGSTNHDVPLEDIGCSKIHARVALTGGKFFLSDLGSRNGTFVNGKRVSPSKVESAEPVEIGHKSELQIGTTTLMCHVHPGRETCLECEPGVVQGCDSDSVFTLVSF